MNALLLVIALVLSLGFWRHLAGVLIAVGVLLALVGLVAVLQWMSSGGGVVFGGG